MAQFPQETFAQSVLIGPATWFSGLPEAGGGPRPVEFALTGALAPTEGTTPVAVASTSQPTDIVTGSGNLTFDLQWDSSVSGAFRPVVGPNLNGRNGSSAVLPRKRLRRSEAKVRI